jgi:hypothetical protein
MGGPLETGVSEKKGKLGSNLGGEDGNSLYKSKSSKQLGNLKKPFVGLGFMMFIAYGPSPIFWDLVRFC